MNRTVTRPRRKNQGGNALIEFALCSTVLLMFLCGITGFSRIFNIESMAQGAAEAGVLYAALSPANYNNLAGVQNAALADTGNYPGATATASLFCTCSVGGAQSSCPASCSSGTSMTYVKVSVTIPYSPVIVYPWVPAPINCTQIAIGQVQ
jgi:Flp pilus assembly protein TadG